jgi:hypothetical protein
MSPAARMQPRSLRRRVWARFLAQTGGSRLILFLPNELMSACPVPTIGGHGTAPTTREFLLLFVGQGVSRLGDGHYTAVVVWLAWTLTHDPSAVALVTTAAYAPAFLATLIGASDADRYDRRRLTIATDLARAAVVALAPILLALGVLNLTLLATGVALLALIGAPFSPRRATRSSRRSLPQGDCWRPTGCSKSPSAPPSSRAHCCWRHCWPSSPSSWCSRST